MSEQSPAEAIFFAALAKGTPAERAAYLDEACGPDAELRRRVERLLAAHPQVGSFLEEPDPGTVDHAGPAGLVGTVLAGRYKLLEAIGEGGMGSVFMAQQTEPLKRLVAVKVIKPGMDSKQVLARFEAERQALALMDHPNIAKVLDADTTDAGSPFFVMELVKGVPITKYCDDRHLTPRQRLELFIPVCQAIQHAHQKGVIHRDVKPTNVLVALYDDRPVPKVIDFGVAKAAGSQIIDASLVTGFGAIVGTPEYMSPEQAQLNQLDIDTRSDVYALGVLLYELLTGTTPIDRKRLGQNALFEILRVIREEEPPRPSTRLSTSEALASIAATRGTEPARLAKLMRGELDWIVMKCLEKDRSRRYETANGLARDLDRYLHDEAVEACPPSTSYRLRKFVHRNKGRVIAAGVFATLLLLVVGLVLYGVWWADRQSAERRHEQELTATRNNDAFKATLDQIEAALKAARLAEAAAMIGQADKRLDEQTPADLRERYERLKKDERTVRELNDIYEERWMVSRSDTRMDNSRAKRRYPALFQKYDLAVGRQSAAEIVEKIHRSVISDALSAGMTEWFFIVPKHPGLLAVVDLLDPDPGRTTLRAAIVNDENDRVKEIGRTIDGSQLAPGYAIGLGTHPAVEDGLRILKAAWTAHPDSFPLTLTICSRSVYLGDDKLQIEAIGWGRTAVALRPNNPLTHYYLALAFGVLGSGDKAHTVEELRRAIRLAPRFAKAYGQLAAILQRDHNTEALSAARKAIEFDNNSLYGHVVILMDLIAKKEYVEAARVYQRIKGLRPDESLHPEDSFEHGYAYGAMMGAIDQIQVGLIRTGRPFEAYRLVGPHATMTNGTIDGGPNDGFAYNSSCAAALAGTGQGLDAPPPAERPSIRKHALEWLNISLDLWKKDAAALAVLGARTVGLTGSPFGQGSLLAMSALAADANSPATVKIPETIHIRMTRWLNDPDLARVRDDQWLAKLPADERAQWRKLWGEVRSLRDRTAPAKAAPPPAGK